MSRSVVFMATEFSRLEAVFTANTRDFDAGLARSDNAVKAFGSKTKAAVSDVANEFRTKFGYLPTIVRQSFSATTQAATKAAQDIVKPFTAAERQAALIAQRTRDLSYQVLNDPNAGKLLDAVTTKGVQESAKRLEAISRDTAKFIGESKQAIAREGQLQAGVAQSFERTSVAMASARREAASLAESFSTVATQGALIGGAVLAAGTTVFNFIRQLADEADRLIKAVIEAGARIHELSTRSGLAAETVSGLDLQLKQSGTSAEKLSTAVSFLTERLLAASEGNKNLQGTFAQLGIKNTTTAMADMEGTLRTVLKSLAQIRNEGVRNAVGTKVLGESYRELKGFLKDTGGNIDAVIAQARRMGLVMSDEAASGAARLKKELATLQSQSEALTREWVESSFPQLEAQFDIFGATLIRNKRLVDEWKGSMLEASSVPFYLKGALGVLGYREGDFEEAGRQRTARAISSAADEISSGTRDFTPVGKSGGGESKAQRAARQALEIAQIASQRANRVADEQLSEANRAYENFLSNLEQLARQQRSIEEQRYRSELETFGKSRELINASVLERGEKNLRLARLQEEEAAALSKHNKRLEDIEYDKRSKEKDAREKHLESLSRIEGIFDERELSDRKAMLEAGLTTREAYETRANAVLYQAFQRRVGLFALELKEAGDNEAQREKVLDRQLEAEEEFINGYEEGLRRIAKAREDDLEEERRYHEELRNIKVETNLLAISIGRNRIERDERLGIRGGRATRRLLDAQDIEAENELYQRRVLEQIAEEGRRILAAKPDQRLSIEKQFYEQAILMGIEHEDRLREIRERGLVEWRDQMKDIANDLTDIVTSGFERGWQGALDGFLNLLNQITAELLNSSILGLLTNKSPQESSAGGLVGFFSNFILGLFGGKSGGSSSGLSGFGSNVSGGLFAGSRAMGGDVSPGFLYKTHFSDGEAFIPRVPGTILNKGQLAGAGGSVTNVYNLNFKSNAPNSHYPLRGEAEGAQALVNFLRKKLR